MDLNQVKSLFSTTDYERGMEYYRQGRVTDMQCSKTDTELNVSCTVRGSKHYAVQFIRRKDSRVHISCSCPRFAEGRPIPAKFADSAGASAVRTGHCWAHTRAAAR